MHDLAPAPAHPHVHAHAGHVHEHGHTHAHPAPRAGFSLIALSAPARLALTLPGIGALWLLAHWALGNG